MTPASALIEQAQALSVLPTAAQLRRARERRVRRFFSSRTLAWILMMAVVAGAVAGGLSVVGGRDRTIAGLRHELTNAHSQLLTATQRGDATGGTLDALRAKVAELRKELVKSKDAANGGAATKTVTKWVPNGEAVTVEVTGYEDMIQVRDVQITHSYGYTDLIGIAVNTSGQTLSYAQLGCTFLDADGNVLANQMDNKQNWLPDQTWGFDCSGQVRGTGGILRVDELG
jgi:hypothetical protein